MNTLGNATLGYHQARTEANVQAAAGMGMLAGGLAFLGSGYYMVKGEGKERIGFGIYFLFCIVALIGWGLVYKFDKDLDNPNLTEAEAKDIEEKKNTIQTVAWVGSAPTILVIAAAAIALFFAMLNPRY
jgi:hypothetical protein